ncbi:MAG: Occludin/ELL family protein [Synechococcaceae cyanobacterium]|nr:Occludin/ELL family protein [Synechococcaceae cyanobacterium]
MVLSCRFHPGATVAIAAGFGGFCFSAVTATPALAGPVVCSTTLEAPPLRSTGAGSSAGYPGGVPLGPVEVTRCGVVRTANEVMNRAFFSWSTPFARGQDLTHQITDLFGIAMGGGDGTKVMGLGFSDQQIMWSVSAMENVTEAMLDSQSRPMPLRTADMTSFYSTSLGTTAPRFVADTTRYRNLAPAYTPVRGLW